MNTSVSTRRFWEARAAALAWRINLAAWFERLTPICFAVASAFAVTLYALRRAHSDPTPAWLALGMLLVGAAVLSVWRERRNFFRADEARVLLEAHLRLDTRLTAATAGLVPWPPAPDTLPPIVRWRAREPGKWLAAAAALVIFAAVAPLPTTNAVASAEKPPSLAQTEAMLQALAQLKAADPRALEQLEQRAAELARKTAEQQYSHSALEASDALRQQTANAIGNLGRGLKAAASAAGSRQLDKSPGRLSAALKGLKDGQLPANSGLLPGDLESLSGDQLSQLAQQLGQLGNAVAGIAGAEGEVPGIGKGAGYGPGQGFGAGGEGGGGDTGPLGLNPNASDVGKGKGQNLKAKDPKLAIGDKLGTTTSAHETDPNQVAGPMSAGAVSGAASGGDAVWVDRLTPSERAALKKFFK